ncbi:MAG: triphosphoribosyl-dephospho-CoA synthase [Bacteroidales bacterium]|nr:triphosphoribosyl-dephospho-CoA synthase [Bacteroidales bacterium]
MQRYREHIIQELPLSSSYFRQKVERFLGENGLRLEELDVYCAIENQAGEIIAGAGLSSDIIKCIAVAAEARSEGLVAPLVSHLISLAASRGLHELKLYTKPENQAIFESLGFHVLATAPKAILMENGRGLEKYCEYLRTFRREGRCGVVVMNANPFTLGHLYLLQQAATQVDALYVIPVKEEGQRFPYAERKAMIQAAVERPTAEQNYFSGRCPKNQFSSANATPTRIVVLEGSAYQISAATFPTYFLKDLSDAADTHIRLDLDLYTRHIAPALNASMRFVGSEPLDALTNHYNTVMKEVLPAVVEVPRMETPDLVGGDVMPGSDRASKAISASAVRQALDEGRFSEAAALCTETTHPYLLAVLAERALRRELDLPGKPGLVCPESNGAHADMNYGTMLRGIAAIRPFFPKMAMAASADELRQLGIEAEKAMMAATGGVNTHRGAIFCLGLALNAWTQCAYSEELMPSAMGKIAEGIYAKSQSDKNLPPRGAMAMALSGYKQLFEDWLPYYEKEGELKTLLRIMSTLDDTCVVKRVGYDRAQQVKQEAKEIAGQAGNDVSVMPSSSVMPDLIGHLCERYAAEGISPGGAADMLALTIFIHSIIS